jgi:hypothetical protein
VQPVGQFAEVGKTRQESDQEHAQFGGAYRVDDIGFAASDGLRDLCQVRPEVAPEGDGDQPACRRRRLLIGARGDLQQSLA